MDENNNNKLEKNENTKDSKKYIEKSDNNIKDSQFSNLANKFNAINAATSYASALTSLQYTINKILPKDYINTMSTSLLQIQNILPHNDMKIMSEILLRKNYLTDMFFKHNINILTEGLTNKIYLSNVVNNIVSQNNILDNIKNINIYYKDTIEKNKVINKHGQIADDLDPNKGASAENSILFGVDLLEDLNKSIVDYVKEYDIDYVVFICGQSNDALNVDSIRLHLGL